MINKSALIVFLHDSVIWYRLNQLNIADDIRKIISTEIEKNKMINNKEKKND